MSNSPFDARPRSSGTRNLRAGLLAAALVGTVVFVYFMTRRGPDTPTAAADHVHEGPSADSAQPVMLTDRDRNRIGVTFAEATMGPLQREVRTVAQVTYDETRVATVALKVDGWVERLLVNETGQPVRRGEPLLELYSPMLVSAEQELLVARRLATDLSGGTGSAQAGAGDLLESARRRLRYWDVPSSEIARLERTGEVGRTVAFAAPVSGVVVEKFVLAGQRVMAGEPLYRIADLGRVWLEGEVFEPDLPAARTGLAVTAEFAAMPGTSRTGHITYVYPTLNPETRTGRIRVELPNADHALKPGMYATIRFKAPTRSVLSVPRSAVLATGERNIVFVDDTSGMFTPREVRLGASTDDRVEIISGIAAGERIVASGTFLLDAESNLGAALGGMGNMPGMDVTAPSKGPSTAPPLPRSPARLPQSPGRADTGMQDMPGMNQPTSEGQRDARQNH